MTFCVSHQKQLNNDPKSDANVANKLITKDVIKDDATRSHENDTVESTESTESTNLGKAWV